MPGARSLLIPSAMKAVLPVVCGLVLVAGVSFAGRDVSAEGPGPAASPESVGAAVASILDAYEAGRVDEAVDLVEEKILSGGRNPEGETSLLVARIYIASPRADHVKKAARYFRWAYVTDPELTETALPLYAETLRRIGDCQEAAGQFRRIISDFPDSEIARTARLGLGACLIENGEAEEAKSLFSELVKREKSVEALLGLMTAYERLGQDRAAARLADRLARDHRDALINHGEALIAAAGALEGVGSGEEAEFYAEEYLREHPDGKYAGRAHMILGRRKRDRDDLLGARQEFAAALESPRSAPEAHLAMARLLRASKQLDEALEHAREVRRSYPYFPAATEASIIIAGILEDREELIKALEAYREANADADVVRVLEALYRKDEEAFLRVSGDYESYILTSYVLAENLLSAGRIDMAGKAFKHQLLGPGRNRALLGLAKVYALLGMEGLALDFVQDLLKRGYRQDGVYRFHAELAVRAGRIREAAEDYRRLKKPTVLDYIRLGEILEGLSRPRSAIAAYGKAVSAGSNTARLRRAELYRRQGDVQKALRDYRQIAEGALEKEDLLWVQFQLATLGGDRERLDALAGETSEPVGRLGAELAAAESLIEGYGGLGSFK